MVEVGELGNRTETPFADSVAEPAGDSGGVVGGGWAFDLPVGPNARDEEASRGSWDPSASHPATVLNPVRSNRPHALFDLAVEQMYGYGVVYSQQRVVLA